MSSLMKIKEDMTSFQLLEKINEFREKEYDYKINKGLSLGKVEIKNGQATLLLHKDLLKIIRDEFEEEINEGKISPVEYIDKKGEKRYMFILNYNQCRQIFSRESKFVRKWTFEYISKLEKENEYLKIALLNKKNSEWLETREQGKLIRRNETDVIASLILMANRQGSKNADKLYITYSSLVNKLVGIKSKQRDVVSVETLEHIRLLEDLISKVIANGIENDTYYKNIYQNCKEKANELIKLLTLDCKLLEVK
jgi:hypothetical protein fuD12_10907